MALSVVPAIPASQIVSVLPSVLAAGGNALDLVGLILTRSTRPPIGQIMRFADANDVDDYFGSTSDEAGLAAVYFNGPNNATAQPGFLLIAQYPDNAVSAWLRGGEISAMPLPTLQAISGTLSVVFDGTTHAGVINLAAATSFSNAADLIQTALNTAVSVTGSIAPNVVTGSIAVNSFTGSLAGTTLTASAIISGVLAPNQGISGASIINGTTIVRQLTGTTGGVGTYQVSISQNVSSTTILASGGGLTVTGVTSGTLAVGQTLTGTGVVANTKIIALGTGAGGTGNYAVDVSQTAASETITASGGTLTVSAVASGTLAVGDVIAGTGVTLGTSITALVSGTGGTGTYLVSLGQTALSQTITVTGAGVIVTYDSVAGAFLVTSGISGVNSTSSYGSGAPATSLLLTAATGATISQGADATDPATFMDGVIDLTTNWASFMTAWEPTDGAKIAFALWNNGQRNRYVYEMWDTNAVNTGATGPSPAVAAVNNNGYSGISMIYEDPVIVTLNGMFAAFEMGWTASLDFTRHNGRQTAAFKAQSGLPPEVFTGTIANYLIGYGLNFYGDYTTPNEEFRFYYPGSVSGDFLWKDSYVNQIWFNQQLQLAIMVGLTNTPSIPYNLAGRALLEAFMMDPINQGVDFGAIVAGINLSAAQIAEINNSAGLQIDNIITQRGWYLQIRAATPQVRRARTSPPCTLWYADGGSVQKVNLASIEVQ
jgi:hypothetical protein